jgi:DMSO reductase family type II enzyme chaperone
VENAALTDDLLGEADLALARSAGYRLLSQAFAYPTPDAVRRLREEDLPFALALTPHLEADLAESVTALSKALHGLRTSQLERAYAECLSHVHSPDCPPYETDFTAGDVFRQTQELADLAGFYRAFGMEGSDGERERPDHVSVELEFMHLLTYKEAWALAQGDQGGAEICREAEADFLTDHVLKWLPEFARRLETLTGTSASSAAHRFYREAARSATALLEKEARRSRPPKHPGEASLSPPVGTELPGGLSQSSLLSDAPGLCEEPG